MIEQRKELTRT